MADIELAAPKPTGDQSSRSNKYDRLADQKEVTAMDMRNCMLVVAALVSAATFQSGMNPPGGVYQDGNLAGKAILGVTNSDAYKIYYFLNAAAFSSANVVISYLVYTFAYYLEIWGAMFCMYGVYGLAAGALSPKDIDNKLMWFGLAFPQIIRFAVDVFKKCCCC